MKLKLFISLLVAGTAATVSAQGFQDGVQYFRADQPEDALEIINRTINLQSTDRSMANYYLGQIAVQQNDFAKAQSLFNEGISANPSNGYNYVGLGELALRQGNPSAASDSFKQARQYAKKDAELITDIARAYFNADPVKYEKEIQKTIADAKKANKNCPAIYILEADMLAAAKNVGEAAGYYEMAMTLDPEVAHPEAYVKYARTYFPVNAKFAIDGIKRLVELQPNSALAQRELAEKYYDNDQYTLAAEQYGKYIQNPNHFQRDEQRYVGLLYFGKKYEQSLDLARQILAKDPDNFYMKRMEFLNLAALERNEAAAEAGEKFMKQKGEFTTNDFTTYGDVLFALGQDSLAVIQYEAAVANAPERTALLSTLSDAYTSAKMYPQAAEAQQRFIDAGDYATNDLMVLARRYQNAAATADFEDPKRPEYIAKGIAALDIVNERVPGNYQVLLTKARLSMIGNNNEVGDEQLPIFLEVLSTLDSDPENLTKRKSDYSFILNALGKYYIGVKDLDNTRLYFGRMSEMFPENADLKAFVDSLNK